MNILNSSKTFFMLDNFPREKYVCAIFNKAKIYVKRLTLLQKYFPTYHNIFHIS